LDLRPDYFRAAGQEPYAVVDIGSNSVRLVIYDRLGRSPFPRFNEKSLCRLGDGLAETGRLGEEAIGRTVRALVRFCAIAAAMQVDRLDVIATEAVRRAENGRELTEKIAGATGLKVRVLDGAEEAHFSALGVIAGAYRPVGLVGDIGGGSLEIAEVVDDQVGARSVSLPLGALPVLEIMRKRGRAAKDEIDAALEGRLPPLLTDARFYAVGGGWRALAAAHMAHDNAPLRVAHAYEIPGEEARVFAKTVSRMKPEEIAAIDGVPSRRAETLPAAALVLERVLKSLKPERVIFSSLGLREGWLYSQLSEEERYHDPLLDGAQAFAFPNARIADFAPALVHWTDALFPGEAPEERRLRVAACALSDIAWRDHKAAQALQSFRRLVRFPFVGISHAERVFLAAAIFARYGGKVADPALEPEISILATPLRQRAEILGRSLLLGYRFSGSVPDILLTSKLRIEAEGVWLEVVSDESVPDAEAVMSRLKMLAKTLNIPAIEPVKVRRLSKV
jgi:exopolyphosphatase/guanosine-5'-triphosphate,3'-diphosphate pyrophosphatase